MRYFICKTFIALGLGITMIGGLLCGVRMYNEIMDEVFGSKL